MRSLITLACLVSAAILVAPSPARPGDLPRFEAYPAGAIYDGPKAPPRLRRGAAAWQYRSAIREAYEKTPVNFAGHHVAVEWGCGAPCQAWAIVDARSGSVYLVPFPTAGGAEYRADSMLFVADPPRCATSRCEGSTSTEALNRGEYSVAYRWNGHGLEEIHAAAKARAPGSRARRSASAPPEATRAPDPIAKP